MRGWETRLPQPNAPQDSSKTKIVLRASCVETHDRGLVSDHPASARA